MDGICSESRIAMILPSENSPDGSHLENVHVADAFSLGNKRVPHVSKVAHAEGLLPSVWIAESGSSSQITPNQRGIFGFRPLKDRTIRTAGGDELSIQGVRTVKLIT